MRRVAALAVVAAALAAGCGDDEVTQTPTQTQPTASPTTQQAGTAGGGTTEPPTTSPAAPTSSTEPDAAPTSSTAPGAAGGDGAEALAFFRSTEATCAAHASQHGNTAPEPDRFAGASVVQQVGDGVWRIVDGAGVELTVDVAGGVIYGVDGPTGLIPHPYSFGCPEDLYLGGVAS